MRHPLRRPQLLEFLIEVLRGENPEPPLSWHDPELWHALLPIADFHGVTLALPHALRALSVWESLPTEIADLLAALQSLNIDRNQAFENQGLAILACLDRAGIVAIPLKGLAYRIIGLYADDLGQRLTGDIDILVPEGQVRQAQEILIARGYTPTEDDHEDTHHHLRPLVPDPRIHGPCCVDIHFRLGDPSEIEELLPAEGMLAGAVDITLDGQRTRVPNTTDLVDHAALHSAINHRGVFDQTIRLRDALDLGRLWTRARAEGCRLSDLRISHQADAGQYFGACLLLNGVPPQDLGALEKPARHYLAKVERRRSVAELGPILRGIAIYGKLMIAQPQVFASKAFTAKPYRTMFHLMSKLGT